MKEKGWLHDPPRRPKGLTKVDKETQESENLIKQDFSATEPLKKLLTDISQIPWMESSTYLLLWTASTARFYPFAYAWYI